MNKRDQILSHPKSLTFTLIACRGTKYHGSSRLPIGIMFGFSTCHPILSYALTCFKPLLPSSSFSLSSSCIINLQFHIMSSSHSCPTKRQYRPRFKWGRRWSSLHDPDVCTQPPPPISSSSRSIALPNALLAILSSPSPPAHKSSPSEQIPASSMQSAA